ncbi:GNAT family N-acetyltransferase [Oceanicaulis sp. MMSF_3324]|uniref:GNAT family N-acetyltransferase n=1 Tax=Oceanicaulis sp. MMSF_3324 TaxID=3046702 RepID=UPI00273F73CC|nr:GNAT family N-acetyltransferase [Oceanicaulis sp. MMSF_3324]
MTDISVRMITAMAQIDPADWDRCANPEDQPYDPFVSWDFLDALETSGSAVDETGWGPRHLIAENEAGQILGVMPLYVKGHSYGEYVFDHAWADALERAGVAYYPKLLTAIPFTPATGRRVLSPDPDIRQALIQAGRYAARELDLSSWHILFPDPATQTDLVEAGLLARQDIQFIWDDAGYGDYEGFLAALSSRKRKALRKERKIAQQDVTIEQLTGDALTEHHWDVFFACYQDTGERKWGTPYLNREFFTLIHERMADKVLLVMAKDGEDYIASALNFIGSDTLYGRYWGALRFADQLHFELCYHQAIDYALAHGLKRVEAGAQGAHKLARGYRPQLVYSAHDVVHEGLSGAVERFLRSERHAVETERLSLLRESPYKTPS